MPIGSWIPSDSVEAHMMTEKKEIYLDNSATTPLSPAALATLTKTAPIYGNPSSLHTIGQQAEVVLKKAREQILLALGVRPRQGDSFVFTSCGTEATSLAILGTAYAKKRRDALRILTTDSEHPSVLRVMELLEEDGFEVIRLSTKGGALNLKELDEILAENKKILLASIMLVNNETGARYEVEDAFGRIKRKFPEAVTHCDAVQGFLKVPFTPASLHADLITVSGHKVHAPKGVGGLYISADMIKKKKIRPFLYGGGQESGMRSGTENLLGIASFGAAVEDIRSRRGDIETHLCDLYTYAVEGLSNLDLRINTPLGMHVSHILNLTLPNIKSETALHFLSGEGIYVSSGSACSSHSHHPSATLLAFGLSPKEADCSLRVSFSEYNTREDIDALVSALSSALERLVRIR